MIFLSLRVTADAEGGLKNRAHLRPVLQGFGGGQPPTSTRRVYTGALLAATLAMSFCSYSSGGKDAGGSSDTGGFGVTTMISGGWVTMITSGGVFSALICSL